MTNKIYEGILIVVISSIFLAFLFGLFDSPEIIKITDSDSIFCPGLIYGNDEEIDFEIKLSNKGSGGGILTSITSPELLIRGAPSETFNKTAIRSWYVDKDKDQPFEFELLKNNSVLNISVNGYFKCKKIFCMKKVFCCNYVKKSEFSSTYELLDENCQDND